jgi:type I restriction enzyme S subunit
MSDIPDGWTYTLLSEIASIQMGQSPNSRSYNEQCEGLPFFQGKSDFGNLFPTVRKWCSEPKTVAEAGEILLSVRAPVGPTNLASERSCIGRGLASIQAVSLFNQKYLLHYFRYIEHWLSQQGTGSTFAGISGDLIRKIEVPVAPLNEQKQIADKLDLLLARVDACRDRLNKIPLIIKNFRCAVLNAAISGELTNDWRLERNRSIDSWQQRNGREVFPFITSGSRGWSSYYSTQGALFLRVGNLNHFTIDLDLNQIQYVNPPINAEGKRTRIEVGDILISITADVGMVAFISENVGEAYINQHLCLARQTGEHLGSYLAYFLSSPLGGIGQLTQMQRGATKAGLALNDIRSVKFLLPDLDEQHEIVSRIESLFAYADYCEVNYQNAFKILKQLTPVILDKAFCGELVSQDPNDEPASILLERIRAERIANLTTQKKQIAVRRPQMSKMSSEAVKKEIFNLPNDKFSFDELHNHLHKQLLGDYDALKEILFTLLDEQPESIIAQRFDSEVEEMCFTRRQK